MREKLSFDFSYNKDQTCNVLSSSSNHNEQLYFLAFNVYWDLSVELVCTRAIVKDGWKNCRFPVPL